MTQLSSEALTGFVAHTELVADPGALLSELGTGGFAWLDEECGFVTAGVAARGTARRLRPILDGLTHRRRHDVPDDSGPRIVGVLPFEGDGDFVLPARIVGRSRDGRAWRTTIQGAEVTAPLRVTRRPPERFTVRPTTEREHWDGIVERALAAIAAGELEKVVLAREVAVDADEPFDVSDVLHTLRVTQPGCTVYAVDGFVGASPELLLRKRDRDLVSRPMAGTGNDPAALLASAKDAHEHRIVVDAIAATLGECCHTVRVDGPTAARFANVVHLATTICGTLTEPASGAVDLVERLHPTPAVGGSPRDVAAALIRALEGCDRGRYAGACGWIDARDDCEFVVALRGAEILGAHASLRAGAGIVAGSEPAAEWAETQAKFAPMLRALVRP